MPSRNAVSRRYAISMPIAMSGPNTRTASSPPRKMRSTREGFGGRLHVTSPNTLATPTPLMRSVWKPKLDNWKVFTAREVDDTRHLRNYLVHPFHRGRVSQPLRLVVQRRVVPDPLEFHEGDRILMQMLLAREPEHDAVRRLQEHLDFVLDDGFLAQGTHRVRHGSHHAESGSGPL